MAEMKLKKKKMQITFVIPKLTGQAAIQWHKVGWSDPRWW